MAFNCLSQILKIAFDYLENGAVQTVVLFKTRSKMAENNGATEDESSFLSLDQEIGAEPEHPGVAKLVINSTDNLRLVSSDDLMLLGDDIPIPIASTSTSPNNGNGQGEPIEEIGDTTEDEDMPSDDGPKAQNEDAESPTTGDTFVYKCVFCDRVLSASDDPRLLECLHNACGSCVKSKLEEQNDTASANNVRGETHNNKSKL